MDSPVEAYLRELRRHLRGNPLLARRVLEEVADHLAEAAAEGRTQGMTRHEAEENAIRRFGPPGPLARRFDRYNLPFRVLLIVASLMTVGVALWLFSVIALVLPARDPAHIPMWRAIALGFLAYSALCLAYLLAGPRNPVLRWSVLLASLAAAAAGCVFIVGMIRRANAGGHFEGYIILMGLILCAHGLIALIYTLLTGRIAGQLDRLG